MSRSEHRDHDGYLQGRIKPYKGPWASHFCRAPIACACSTFSCFCLCFYNVFDLNLTISMANEGPIGKLDHIRTVLKRAPPGALGPSSYSAGQFPESQGPLGHSPTGPMANLSLGIWKLQVSR